MSSHYGWPTHRAKDRARRRSGPVHDDTAPEPPMRGQEMAWSLVERGLASPAVLGPMSARRRTPNEGKQP